MLLNKLKAGIQPGQPESESSPPPQSQEPATAVTQAGGSLNSEQVASTNNSEEGDFPEENPDVGEELNSNELFKSLPTQPEIQVNLRNVELEQAAAQLTDNEKSPGAKQPFGLAHSMPLGHDVAAHQDKLAAARANYVSIADRTPYDSKLLGSTDDVTDDMTDTEVVDKSLANQPCCENLALIHRKLSKFTKTFYLATSLWEPKTLDYLFRAYASGMRISAIHDRVGAPSRSFADAQGVSIPTFKQTRAELGNLRVIDVYAILAVGIYLTAISKSGGKIKCGTGEYAEYVNGIVPRTNNNPGEISVTTFVDMIYLDYTHPQSLGHKGIADFLADYGESMGPTHIRRLYDSLIVRFRDRWKKNVGGNRSLRAKSTSSAEIILKALDTALANHTAILESGSRRFLLTEWPGKLPSSLPRFSAVQHELVPSDIKLFLRKFLESFDPALPFDRAFINTVRAELGPAGGKLLPPGTLLDHGPLKDTIFADRAADTNTPFE